MPHSYLMEKALECAFSRIGITSPNPPVGAVIASGKTVLAVGGTQPYGYDHAEITALKQLKQIPSDACMYVTLEPCCHFGKTPPCTNAIIASGIKKVFVGTIDPNPLVSGKGVEALRNAGISVTLMREYEYACRELIRPFTTLITKKRPHVLHKAAMTLDGCTATRTKDSKWITSNDSRAVVHRFRSLVDAVIIGKGTYATDDPSLNVRQTEVTEKIGLTPSKSWYIRKVTDTDFPVRKESPLRVIVGRPDDFSNRNVFFDDNYIIFCADDSKVCALPDYVKEEKMCYVSVSDRKDLVPLMMEKLMGLGVMSCMLEGGAELASSFYTSDMIDEVAYFYAPTLLGGGYPLFARPECGLVREGKRLHELTILAIGRDMAVHGVIGE